MHFHSYTDNDPAFVGEFTIDDLTLFCETGKLADVERKWRAVIKYALLVDRSHDAALAGVKSFLQERANTQPSTEGELDAIVMANVEFDALRESDEVIVKSLIFLLLVSFRDYGLKQIQMMIDPQSPLPERSSYNATLDWLKKRKLMENPPEDYTIHFSRFYDPVRNNLAHGDWMKLGQALFELDLTKAFFSVANYFGFIKANLAEQNYDV